MIEGRLLRQTPHKHRWEPDSNPELGHFQLNALTTQLNDNNNNSNNNDNNKNNNNNKLIISIKLFLF